MKIGVVGYGSIGQRHAANAKALGHEVIVFDPMLQHNDVKFERLIYEQADAVVIATPSPVHEGCLRACIERGKHALVEKPISVARGALAGLLLAASEKKLVVMMGNNLRFHPCVVKVQEWLDADPIGKPIWAQFTCATMTEKPGILGDGVVLNTGSHEVDLALHFFGRARVLTAALTESDMIADFVLLHESGVRSSFHLDFVTKREIREFRIVGTEGDLICNLPHRYLGQKKQDDDFEDSFVGSGSYDDDYIAEMRAFIDKIEGKETLGASGMDGYMTLNVLLDVKQKAGL